MDATLGREESFHDEWAASVDLEQVLVDESFEACTAPECRWLMEQLGDIAGKRILDLGCGIGEAAVYFAKHGAHVTASDLSAGMLRVAARLAARHGVCLETAKCSATDVSLPDETFDIVYAGNLLHHVEIEPTLREVHRLLKPGGVFVSWDPIKHNPLIKIYRRVAADVRTRDEHPLAMRETRTFRQIFRSVRYECFWLFTLWIFLRFLLIERVSPNKERYWKKIIIEHERLEPIYRRWARVDRWVLRAFPFLKRFCWNIALVCEK